MFEESVIFSKIFCPAFVPNAAVQLTRAALPIAADNSIKMDLRYHFELVDGTVYTKTIVLDDFELVVRRIN